MDTAGDKLKDELRDVAEAAEALLGEVRPGLEQIAEQVRRHPVAALGIAAGAGLVLGLLLARK